MAVSRRREAGEALSLWRLAALVVAAFSRGPSFAHVLEAPPRLGRWAPELWREATVFGGQYQLFGSVGGALDAAAVAVTAIMAYRVRGQAGAGWAIAGAACFALSLAAWFAIVAPANGVLATWAPGPLPANFEAVRNRWEVGHLVVEAWKSLGFLAVALSVAQAARPDRRIG